MLNKHAVHHDNCRVTSMVNTYPGFSLMDLDSGIFCVTPGVTHLGLVSLTQETGQTSED